MKKLVIALVVIGIAGSVTGATVRDTINEIRQLRADGEHEQALKQTQTALKREDLTPVYEARLIRVMGYIHSALGNVQEAEQVFKRLADGDYNDRIRAMGYYNLFAVRRKAGADIPELRKILKNWLNIDTNASQEAVSHFWGAWLYREVKNDAQQLRHYQECLRNTVAIDGVRDDLFRLALANIARLDGIDAVSDVIVTGLPQIEGADLQLSLDIVSEYPQICRDVVVTNARADLIRALRDRGFTLDPIPEAVYTSDDLAGVDPELYAELLVGADISETQRQKLARTAVNPVIDDVVDLTTALEITTRMNAIRDLLLQCSPEYRLAVYQELSADIRYSGDLKPVLERWQWKIQQLSNMVD